MAAQANGKVICQCETCSQLTFTAPTGQTLHGKLLHQQTVARHRKKDRALLATATQASPMQNSSVQEVSRRISELVVSEPVEQYKSENRDSDGPSGILLIFLAWLHLVCGLSQENCSIAGKFLMRILDLAMKQHKHKSKHVDNMVPSDIRTVLKKCQIEPDIRRFICCPKCHSLYTDLNIPQTCLFRESSRAKVCGGMLYKLRKLPVHLTQAGLQWELNNQKKIKIPTCLYSTQILSTWLEWFLQRPEIEDDMLAWTDALETKRKEDPSLVHDIQQSEAWKRSGSHGVLELVFSIYVDWFNPYGNKIAGKKYSTGCILLNCLNLSPTARNKSLNTFIAGITPQGQESTMITFNHLLRPLVDQLCKLSKGVSIETFRYPQGRKVVVKLLPLIADVVAAKKVAGFTSHSGSRLCSWCTKHKLDLRNHSIGILRTQAGTRQQAENWRLAQTKAEKKSLVKKYGVRWSELNRLDYWDPSGNSVLGIMHNWLEGILQEHCRVRLGVGEAKKKPVKPNGPQGNDCANEYINCDEDIEMEDLEMMDVEELEDLYRDIESHSDIPNRPESRRGHLYPFKLVDEAAQENDSSEVDSDFRAGSRDLEEDLGEETTDDGSSTERDGSSTEGGEEREDGWVRAGPKVLSEKDLSILHEALHDIILPSHINRPPRNLGEAKHGKLKAHQWWSLFSLILPMVLPELWYGRSAQDDTLLENFEALVVCTDIVCSYVTSEGMAEKFEWKYNIYLASSDILFPESPILPNHHYAQHVPSQLKRWGPLLGVSEFPGERTNGMLQKVQTNHSIDKMDYTMLHKLCQAQRLNVLKGRQEFEMMTICAAPKGKETTLPQEIYTAFLEHLLLTYPNARHFKALPHPPGSLVINPRVSLKRTLALERFRVSASQPNNCIQFFSVAKETQSAFVQQIFHSTQLKTTYLYIQAITPFDSPIPYLSSMAVILGKRTQKHLVISQDQVLGPLAHRFRPMGTLGVAHPFYYLKSVGKGLDLQKNI